MYPLIYQLGIFYIMHRILKTSGVQAGWLILKRGSTTVNVESKLIHYARMWIYNRLKSKNISLKLDVIS